MGDRGSALEALSVVDLLRLLWLPLGLLLVVREAMHVNSLSTPFHE